MWFRTALILILFLVALRLIRGVLARLTTVSTPAKPDQGTHRPRGTSSTGAAAESRPAPSTWPPGEVTDVNFREAHPDESSTR